MNWTPATMTENEEDEQQLECNRRDDEEVYRDQVLGMVLEKGPPSLRGRIAVPYQVYGDGRLRNFDSDLQQFSVNTRSTQRGLARLLCPIDSELLDIRLVDHRGDDSSTSNRVETLGDARR